MRALRGPASAYPPGASPAEPVAGGWIPEGDWPQPADPDVAGAASGGIAGAAGRPEQWAALRDALADRLPPSVRGAGVAISRRAAVALAGAALTVAAVTGWVVLHGGGRQAAVAVTPVQRAVPTRTASAGPVKVLVVDVAGKVRRPGVVRLPVGSRVVDALRAAGGARPGVDIGLLNLARQLVDGEQVVVGLGAGDGGPPVQGAGAGAGGAASGVVDLNSATLADLDALPGVGPVLAQRILDWRSEHGPFTGVEQLREVAGIGDRKFQDLKSRVRV